MPTISKFHGMTIYMYAEDHNPPHFHVKVEGKIVVVNIKTKRIKGFLPYNQKRLIEAWCILHEKELLENWNLLILGKKPYKIAPLA